MFVLNKRVLFPARLSYTTPRDTQRTLDSGKKNTKNKKFGKQ